LAKKKTTKIKKILIANRGEIAVRIIRACHEMGIEAVAVYSEADRWARFVGMANEAYCIGPAPAVESYLKIDTIIDVAKQCKADAIHPGYGFLAENPLFAAACEKAKIKFIGPSSAAIEQAGNKVESRKLAKKLKVPTVPGMTRGVTEKADLKKIKKDIGFPVLIKAAAGGGGKGMRVVEDPKDFARAVREAKSEAKSAFGNATVFLEKYLVRPRHIEIQIFADEHGNVVHLGERECSIQRRHQKLVEESPSPVMTPELREEMGACAVRFAEGVNYANAGTVEFLVDADMNFYLLEMNTRLQVEHPVTEWVTGIDMVQAQIRVARGEKLPWSQDDIELNGHAIECRINAEDAAAGFVPSTGPVLGIQTPSGPFIRVDNGIKDGDSITPHYDSMVAKFSTWGVDRAHAIARMEQALSETKIVGVDSTVGFHQQLLADEKFRKGEIHTGFIGTDFDYEAHEDQHLLEALLIACALESERKTQRRPFSPDKETISGWKQMALIHGLRGRAGR
jgi:acetyl-CoA carboxylase biotin carboxylase subunit